MTSLISLESVAKSFWRGSREIAVLKDVSFALHPGDLAAVLGDRRSGKTTLLRIAAGIDTPDVGTVSFRGRSLADLPEARRADLWREQIACAWSSGTWQARTVLETVTIPLLGGRLTRREARRRASDELARWGIEDAASAMVYQLSDAERQRVALARALVRQPSVLIADDPTETLNLIERNHLLAKLKQIVRDQDLAVLISSTDASGAAGVNRLLNLVGNGEVREAQTAPPTPIIPLPTRLRTASRDA